MSDFISREDALKKLNYKMKHGSVFDQSGLGAAYDIIESIPSAEPDRKKGKWIDVTERLAFPECKCSVCQSKSGMLWMKFCPNCGADMRGDHE